MLGPSTELQLFVVSATHQLMMVNLCQFVRLSYSETALPVLLLWHAAGGAIRVCNGKQQRAITSPVCRRRLQVLAMADASAQ